MKQLLSARLALRAAIKQVRGTVRHGTEFANLIKIMLCIADTIMPNTYIPVPSDSLTFASPLPKAKRSCDAPHSAQSSKEYMPTPLLKRARVVRIRNSMPILIQELPILTPQPPLDITSPGPFARDTVVLTHLEDGESSDTSESINYFSTVSLNAMSSESRTTFVMDSGAGKCGTSNLVLLKNITACQGITVNGAFGTSVNPAHTGTFGPLNLPAVHIDGMGSQTLVSLSQFCAGGTTGTKYIGVYTPKEYRMYEMQSALLVFSTLAKTGKGAERGRVQNGIYFRESS